MINASVSLGSNAMGMCSCQHEMQTDVGCDQMQHDAFRLEIANVSFPHQIQECVSKKIGQVTESLATREI